MLRLTNLANKYERRTLRALYSQTQGYPYDVQLASTFNRNVMWAGASGTKAAIYPGLVATKTVGETVTLANANTQPNARPFGLFANYVGGELSDIPPDFDRVGVWRGAGSVYQILAPVFDDTGLAAAAAGETGNDAANEVYLVPNANGALTLDAGARGANETARLIRRLSSRAIIVELLV